MDKIFNKLPDNTKKTATGIAGGVVVVVGIILIPFPGPGWLIVFIGLSILAKEFPWAGRLLKYTQDKYNDWNKWVMDQSMLIRSIIFGLTGVIALTILWLCNIYGITADLFGLNWDWAHSPLFGK